MNPLIIVPGTHSGDWALPHSPCRRFLATRGYLTFVDPWSYDVDGVPSLLDYAGNSDWEAGGYSTRFLLYALGARGMIDLTAIDLLTHSHGINPAICQTVLPPINGLEPLRIRRLISICAPPREDVQPGYQEARKKGLIGFHRAIYAAGWDLTARLGQLFDGSWSWAREWRGADQNIGLKGIGHSKLLNDAAQYDLLGELLEV